MAAIISPGEPLHLKKTERHWLIDWYLVREYGVTLFGPPPRPLIENISREEFLRAVQKHLTAWRGSVSRSQTRGPQKYAVLIVCRGLYTLRHGRHASKKQAALWAQHEFPEWAPIIRRALASANDDAASEAEHVETVRFVEFAIDAAQGGRSPSSSGERSKEFHDRPQL